MRRIAVIAALLAPGSAWASCPATLTDCPTVNANTINGAILNLPNLPTSAPSSPTQVWNNNGFLSLSATGGGGSCNTLVYTFSCNSQYIGLGAP